MDNNRIRQRIEESIKQTVKQTIKQSRNQSNDQTNRSSNNQPIDQISEQELHVTMSEDSSRNASSPPLDIDELQSFLKISISESNKHFNNPQNEHSSKEPNKQSNDQSIKQSNNQSNDESTKQPKNQADEHINEKPRKRSRSINEAEDVQAYLSITKTLKQSMPPPPNRPPKRRPNLLGSPVVKQEESRSIQQHSERDNDQKNEQFHSSDESLSSDDDDGGQSPEHDPLQQSSTIESGNEITDQPIKKLSSQLDNETTSRSINPSQHEPAEAADGGENYPSEYVKRFYDEDTAAERRRAIDQAYHRRLQQVDQLIMRPLTEAAQQHLNNQDEDQKLLQERDEELDTTLSEFIAYLHKVRMTVKPQSKQSISANA